MDTKNPLGIEDREMVLQLREEARRGGQTITRPFIARFSAAGFIRLRDNKKYAPLSDHEKRDTAYLATAQFLQKILSGDYQPLEGKSCFGYFWTICHCRAVDELRKLLTRKQRPGQPPVPAAYQDDSGAETRAFAHRVSFDDDPLLLSFAQEAEQISGELDRKFIWDSVRSHLKQHCYDILKATIREGRKNAEVSKVLGYSPTVFKSTKTKCLGQLRAYLRPYFGLPPSDDDPNETDADETEIN